MSDIPKDGQKIIMANPLVERLRSQAQNHSNKTVLTVLGDTGADAVSLSFGQLDLYARALAARLQQAGAEGARALIVHPPGIEYVISLFACFYAGVTAVPAYPARRRQAERLLGIIADCGARYVIGDSANRDWLPQPADAATPAMQWINREQLDDSAAQDWRPAEARADVPCLLQYTSGSTSAPKGVMLSQANFIANVDSMAARAGIRADDCYVCWLPPFHDMGLISGILAPLCLGVPTVLLMPIAFQRRPMKWLEAISKYRGTISGGPNFGYELCVRRLAPPEKLAELDLSQWRMAFCGAERIRPQTFERFAQAMAPTGFQSSALTPCYGLAESTVGVSSSPPLGGWRTLDLDEAALSHGRVVDASLDKPSLRLVGCGQPLPGCDLRIVDPQTRQQVPADQSGEIWIRSSSVGAGYWGKSELSDRSFRARLDGQVEDAPVFLRTGDMGFMREGELFVAGRIKDLIILRGANHFPEDIEASMLRCLPEKLAGACAAFSVERNAEEALVLVQELDSAQLETAAALGAAIRDAITEHHEILVEDIVFVASGTIPRTSSGKIQRSACRELYLNASLRRVASAAADADSAAPEELVGRIAATMAALLELPSVAATDDFFWLGGHSLLATQLVSRLRQSCAVDVTLRTVFEGATPQKLAARIAALPRIAEPAPIQAAPAGTAPVLSFSQERMWLLHQLEPDSAAYNVGGGLLMEGELDLEAFGRAFECVTMRHEVLRAKFPAQDGAPTMVIADAVTLPIAVHDVSANANPLARATQEAEAFLHQPFDVANESSIRLAMWRLGPTQYLFVASLHHLITDAWSMGLLISDALGYYDELLAGRQPVVQPTPYAYSDFARWQREQMSGDKLAQELQWWSSRLAGASPVEIPTDRPRAARRGSDGAYLPMDLPPGLLDALTTVGAAEGTTLFMVLLAAFEVLLARHTGSDDLVVGIPVANRNELASELLMGSLVNTLALRVQVSPEQSFLSVLRQVREIAIDAYTHQDLPFERLVTSMRLERRPGESPLVNVLFDFQNAPVPGRDSGPLRIKPMHLGRGSAQFDLNLLVMDTELGRLAGIEYRTELFDEATMRRMLQHYIAILEQIVSNPATPVERFVLVDEVQRNEQLALSVPVGQPAALAPSVPQSIHMLALSQPQSVALVDDAGSVSYAQLEDQANQLAAQLLAMGAGPGERVVVLLERSRDLVAALLATLKTGAAYVPLDPRFPADRIGYVLEDAQPRVVITRSQWQDVAAGLPNCDCLLLDALALGDGAAAAVLPATTQEDRAAYVIYTSGSTGRPKGVEVGMAALVNFLGSMAHTPGLGPQDRVLALTTVAFDIAGLEIWLPLVNGACVRILTEDTATDPMALMQCMDSWRPTLMQATPATWKMLLSADWTGDPTLKILCGGEAMPADLAQALRPRCAALWNMYGPTETTIWSSLHQVQEDDGARIPIGRPIDRTRLYVLDRLGQLQPRGVTGELAIGGAGVAMGYFKRPDLTAERFVPDPFSDEPGARMYRTGDGARLRSDGRFECLARMDDQIKLRGFRIEPGEIEAVLKEDPAVLDAVVVAYGKPPDDARLVAYYVAPEPQDNLEERLFMTLNRRLPDYMVPGVLMRLDKLPQTPNAKVDRRALPAPQIGQLQLGTEYVAPRDDIETRLVGIWQDLLEVPRVGIRDNFFRLGGYSLLAIRVLARIRQQLGVTLPPAVLIERPTIEHLADAVRADAAPVPEDLSGYRYLVPFGPQGARPRLVCVHGAGGNVLNFAALADRLGANRALLGIQSRGVDGRERPFERIEEMAAAYLQELRAAQPQGPYFLAGYCGGGVVAHAMANQLQREGQEIALLVLIDCYRPGLVVREQSRSQRWSEGLRKHGIAFIAQRAAGWVQRHGGALWARSLINLNTLLGRQIPFALRDFWLTSAFLASTRHFAPAPYAGELTLLRAVDVDSELAEVGPELGWSGLASRIQSFEVPGNHFTLLDHPNVEVLATKLAACMEQAARSGKR
jgi:amino acid adenylation domain-containing protein